MTPTTSVTHRETTASSTTHLSRDDSGSKSVQTRPTPTSAPVAHLSPTIFRAPAFPLSLEKVELCHRATWMIISERAKSCEIFRSIFLPLISKEARARSLGTMILSERKLSLRRVRFDSTRRCFESPPTEAIDTLIPSFTSPLFERLKGMLQDMLRRPGSPEHYKTHRTVGLLILYLQMLAISSHRAVTTSRIRIYPGPTTCQIGVGRDGFEAAHHALLPNITDNISELLPSCISHMFSAWKRCKLEDFERHSHAHMPLIYLLCLLGVPFTELFTISATSGMTEDEFSARIMNLIPGAKTGAKMGLVPIDSTLYALSNMTYVAPALLNEVDDYIETCSRGGALSALRDVADGVAPDTAFSGFLDLYQTHVSELVASNIRMVALLDAHGKSIETLQSLSSECVKTPSQVKDLLYTEQRRWIDDIASPLQSLLSRHQTLSRRRFPQLEELHGNLESSKLSLLRSFATLSESPKPPEESVSFLQFGSDDIARVKGTTGVREYLVHIQEIMQNQLTSADETRGLFARFREAVPESNTSARQMHGYFAMCNSVSWVPETAVASSRK